MKPCLPICALTMASALLKVHAEPGDILKTLPANSWYEMPNTNLYAPPAAVYFGATAGSFPAIISAWSGGIYDALRNRLVIWGGGHNDYYGNQLYALVPDSLKWQRLNWPSPINPDKNQCIEVLSDGAANARHTYAQLAYIAHADRMFASGGSLGCFGGGGGSAVWTFDFKTLKWQNMNPSGTSPVDDCCSMSCAYDPLTKKVFYRSKGALAAYDYDNNRWTTLRSQSRGGNEPVSTIDTKRRLLFTIGSGIFEVTDLSGTTYPISSWSTTGGSAIVGAQGPGLVYVPSLDRIVAWAGGNTVYTLDIDAKTWTSNTAPGGPANTTARGTYGRWQYIPKQNGFLVITATDENVHFYKMTAGVAAETPEVKNLGNDALQAFPNPFRENALLRFSGNKKEKVSIFDSRGVLITRLSLDARGETWWNAETAPAGIYLAQTDATAPVKRLLKIR